MTGAWGIPTQMGLTHFIPHQHTLPLSLLHYRWLRLPPPPTSAAPITHNFFYFSSGVLWEVRKYCETIVALTF